MNYECTKCKNTEFTTDEVAMTSGGLGRFFDVQNKKFSTVTCTKCQYTEFYEGESSMLSNIVDLFTS
jgi:uncharacterized protein